MSIIPLKNLACSLVLAASLSLASSVNAAPTAVFEGNRTSVALSTELVTLNSAVAGPKTAHLAKITLSFEFSVLTLTVPGLRLRKVQNTSCF